MQGSVVRSWLCELAARAFEQEGNDLEEHRAATSTDSGEGRWTVEDAIEQRRPDAGDHRLAATRASTRAATATSRPRSSPRCAPSSAATPCKKPRHERIDRDTPAADNPLVEGLERLPVHPTTLAIFGATGDLAKRKLLPALYNLAHEGALPERFNLDRRLAQRDARRGRSRAMATRGDPRSSRAASPTRRCSTALLDARPLRRRARSTTRPSTTRLARRSTQFDEEAGQPLNRAFYLSTAPEFFPVIVEQLGDARARPPRGRRGAGASSRSRSARRWPRPASSTTACCRSSRSARSSASTTTWARRPSRT